MLEPVDFSSLPLSPTPLQVLREVFGYQEFRPGQAHIVEQLVAGRDGLVIMPDRKSVV